MIHALHFKKPKDAYNIHPFNALKLVAHTDRVEAMLRGELVYPVSVEIDLTLKCNHACEWCSFDGWRQANWVDMPEGRAVSLMGELAEVGVKSVTLTGGGEPLVHRGALDVMHAIVRHGMEFGVVTNGWMLKGPVAEFIAAHATFVRVSLDAGTSDTHQRIHKAPMPQFETILEQMRDVRDWSEETGNTLTIGASFCVFDSNVSEMEMAASAVRNAGGDYLEVRPVYPTTWRGGRQDDAGLSPENIEFAKSTLDHCRKVFDGTDFRVIGLIDRFDAVQSFRHRDFYESCRITNLSTVISADGQIYACCVHRGLPQFAGGSIFDRPFKEVWAGTQRRAVSDNIDIDKCPKCRYVGLNAVIESGLMRDELHRNFI